VNKFLSLLSCIQRIHDEQVGVLISSKSTPTSNDQSATWNWLVSSIYTASSVHGQESFWTLERTVNITETRSTKLLSVIGVGWCRYQRRSSSLLLEAGSTSDRTAHFSRATSVFQSNVERRRPLKAVRTSLPRTETKWCIPLDESAPSASASVPVSYRAELAGGRPGSQLNCGSLDGRL